MKEFHSDGYCNKANNIPTFKFALREDLINDKSFLPVRATEGSAGWDVACAFDDHKSHTIQPGEYVKIPLGIRSIAAPGFWYEMKPRSSSFVKKKLHALYGTIDNDFRNQLCFCAKYDGNEPLILDFKEKVGQIIPIKLQEMEVQEIPNEEFDKICQNEYNTRTGGFGSTSK